MLEKFTYYFHTIYRWIVRCRYSRGFGIQSPSVYSFVCNVINVHNPYYAYEEFADVMSDRPKSFHKLGRLFFRLANYWQPIYTVMGDYDYAPYIYAGCKNTLVRMIDDYYFEEECNRALVIIDIDWLSDVSLCEEILSAANDQLLLVLTNIHANHAKRLLWRNILSDDRCGVTYDLYSCGIIFFDKSKHRQDFKINF